MDSTRSASQRTTRAVELRDGSLASYAIEPVALSAGIHGEVAVRAGDPALNAEVLRAVLEGERGAERDITVVNAAAAIYVGGRAESLAEGIARRRAGPRLRRGARVDGALRRGTRGPGRRRERAARGARGGHSSGASRSASRRCPRRRSSVASQSLPAAARLPGSAHATRRRGDRRAQAAIALGRHDPRAARASQDIVSCLRARRGCGALDPHRAGPLRRLARGHRRGSERRRACRSCARTSSSTATSCSRHGRTARTRCCSSSGRVRAADLAALHEQASELSLDAIVEVHDDAELEVALELGAPLDRDQQPRPGRLLASTSSARSSSSSAIPRGATVISESGILTARARAAPRRLGVDAVLVGEALMRADDPAAACRALAGSAFDGRLLTRALEPAPGAP